MLVLVDFEDESKSPYCSLILVMSSRAYLSPWRKFWVRRAYLPESMSLYCRLILAMSIVDFCDESTDVGPEILVSVMFFFFNGEM